jgi:hypothetical protein
VRVTAIPAVHTLVAFLFSWKGGAKITAFFLIAKINSLFSKKN